jgi:hypothetical protein
MPRNRCHALPAATHHRLVLDRGQRSLFELARFTGTSVEQIGHTYGHLLPGSFERARTALDSFLAAPAEAKAERS